VCAEGSCTSSECVPGGSCTSNTLTKYMTPRHTL
jgi:hypothetical protein